MARRRPRSHSGGDRIPARPPSRHCRVDPVVVAVWAAQAPPHAPAPGHPSFGPKTARNGPPRGPRWVLLRPVMESIDPRADDDGWGSPGRGAGGRAVRENVSRWPTRCR
eukprot:scaffold1581_cov342-Prasinococcus_capsulatus_cf.AAC.15